MLKLLGFSAFIAPVAQTAEHLSRKENVGGSIPSGGSIPEVDGARQVTIWFVNKNGFMTAPSPPRVFNA